MKTTTKGPVKNVLLALDKFGRAFRGEWIIPAHDEESTNLQLPEIMVSTREFVGQVQKHWRTSLVDYPGMVSASMGLQHVAGYQMRGWGEISEIPFLDDAYRVDEVVTYQEFEVANANSNVSTDVVPRILNDMTYAFDIPPAVSDS